MSGKSYVTGCLYQAIDTLISDAPQIERIQLACTHIAKGTHFHDAILSDESQKELSNMYDIKADDPDYISKKSLAIRNFLVSAIKDTTGADKEE